MVQKLGGESGPNTGCHFVCGAVVEGCFKC